MHVKLDLETLRIKGNLELYHRKLQQQEPSKSSLNIEDQTLSERDMLIKELKDINFLSKKCREKGSKVRAEIAQNTKAYHTLKSSYDSRECLVDSQMKQLNFLNLLSESYTEKISGEKLNQLSADSKALTGYCGELTSNGKVNSKALSMNRFYAECVEGLKAATSNPKEPVKTVDPSLICFQDCDNNPDIIINKKFSQKHRLTVHMSNAHGEHGSMPNLCMVCGQRFVSPFTLRKHMVDKHQKKMATLSDATFFKEPDYVYPKELTLTNNLSSRICSV